MDYKLWGMSDSTSINLVDQSLLYFIVLYFYSCAPKPQDETLRNLLTKDVPKDLIISSNSIRLLDAVGQGTFANGTL